jgi:hypothetical protein
MLDFSELFAIRRNRRFLTAAAIAAASLCSACSTIESLVPSPDKGDQPNVSPSVRETGVSPSSPSLAAHSGDVPAEVLPLSAEDLDCPTVDVADGKAFLRVGGPDNAAVRYQFNLGDTARECQPVGVMTSVRPGAQATIKIGVRGNAILGPAGSPGTYSAPLHVTIEHATDHKIVFSKVYKVEAVTGATQDGAFQFVTEPIPLTMYRPDLADDYDVTIGFDGGSGNGPAPKHQRVVPKS